MESVEGKVRKITAAWDIHEWEIKDSIVFITFNGVKLGFDLVKAELPDYKSKTPLTIVLEIPCPPSPTTNPTTT